MRNQYNLKNMWWTHTSTTEKRKWITTPNSKGLNCHSSKDKGSRGMTWLLILLNRTC